MRGLILILGESFRLGGQGTRNRGDLLSYDGQMKATNSHIHFLEHVQNKYNCDINVYLSTYNTQFNNCLLDKYCKYLIGNCIHENLIGINDLFHNSVNNIQNIEQYDFVFYLRVDICLKHLMIDIFNPNTNMITYPSVCFIPHHNCGVHPRINDMFIFIPKRYYPYINDTHVCHESWFDLVTRTNLRHNDLDLLVKTYHDSDSAKDWNPMYYIVNRDQCAFFSSEGKVFDKNLNHIHCDSIFNKTFYYNNRFIINKYLFFENEIYKNSGCEIAIKENVIEFNKINPNKCLWAWIGYEMRNPGIYNVSFEMYSNKDIINYSFIKSHKPKEVFHKKCDILANTWTKINLEMHVTNNDELICFILDEFEDTIFIKYKDITFKKVFDNRFFLKNHLFFENEIYKNSGCEIAIKENVIEFNKINPNKCLWAWIGYEIRNPGIYNISLEMHSNKDIINYSFIKSHKPEEVFHKTCDILANTWTQINLKINVTCNDELICFIFDEFEDTIFIKYKNINII